MNTVETRGAPDLSYGVLMKGDKKHGIGEPYFAKASQDYRRYFRRASSAAFRLSALSWAAMSPALA